jgi:spore coat polysaccharide biosynthesis predicted glycosyltransferase SpsG
VAPELTLEAALGEASAADIVIVDSYDVQARHLDALRRGGVRVLVLDDLADRPLPATWLLNPGVNDATCYRGLTDANLLLGPAYALLRSQFRGLPPRPAFTRVRRVLVTFGGSDSLGLTARAVRALDAIPGPLEVRIVAGLLAGAALSVSACHRVEVLRDVTDMAGLMQWADLAVSAAGQTIFELAAAGCPAVCLVAADNQARNAVLFEGVGSAVVLDGRLAGNEAIGAALRHLADDPDRRAAMNRAGRAAVDGCGTQRVAGILSGAD